MFSAVVRPRKLLVGLIALAMLSTGLGIGLGAVGVTPASADTQPTDPNLPTTVSSDALPTVQINGIVWAQIIVGDRVYATGEFSQARPAGAAAGQNQTPRQNILAYNLNTGALITTWAPTLNAQGMALAASPDGSVIYVGGDFSQVNGTARNRVAAISATTGALVPNWNPIGNNRVTALAVNDNTLYIGGFFTQMGGQPRSRIAAVNRTSGALLTWAPSPDRDVATIVPIPSLNRVIIGGSFANVNGTRQDGMTSIDMTSGQLMPWAVNVIIHNSGEGSYISGLVYDGNKVYGSGWNYGGGGGTGNFEGVFAADPATGALVWVNGCRGDRYSIALSGGAVYTGGHYHDCGMLENFPQFEPDWRYQMAQAFDTNVSPYGLTNAFGNRSEWAPFPGRPAAEILHWMPDFALGSYTGLYQASWSVAGNNDYVVYGGEFPRVNGIGQQGLVRFARREIAPNRDPIQGINEARPTLTAMGPGTVRVAWTAPYDRDNERLTVEVLRGANLNSATVLRTLQTDTAWWDRPLTAIVDASAPPGSSQTYRLRVRDAYNNNIVSQATTIVIPSGAPVASTYADAVQADQPRHFWRLDETTGTTALDRPNRWNDLQLNSAVQRNVAGAPINETNAGVNFPGSTSTNTVQGVAPSWEAPLKTFTLETWIRTNTNTGGKIIGFGDQNDGRSNSNLTDRHIYMTNNGQLRFGVRPDMGTRVTINSPTSYNDNQWHHVVASLGADGMNLYVDGNRVASNPAVTKAQVYWGYWRVGGDRLSSWPSAPTREAFTGNIDETAIYPTALTIGDVRQHFLASGRTGSFPNVPPVASFTSAVDGHDVAFTSTSTDPDGTIQSHLWDFGDGNTSTEANPHHTYSSAATWPVTLTVTDNANVPNTTNGSVTTVDPPPNVAPVASFTSAVDHLDVTFTSTSTDSDGTIEGYLWDFGDGNTSTEQNPQHHYATAADHPVSLTVTDNDSDSHTATGSVTTTNPPPEFALDAFGRTVANGFGTADLGGTWTLQGAATSFSVATGAGRIAGVTNANRGAYLTTVAQTDTDTTVDVALNTAANNGGAYTSIIGRRISNGNDYRLKIRYMPNGIPVAYIVRTLGGVETLLGWTNVNGITLSPGDTLTARLQITGNNPTTVRAKIWRQGTTEPTPWLLTGTDTTTPALLQGPGHAGILLYVSNTWTGTAPTLTIDNLKVAPLP